MFVLNKKTIVPIPVLQQAKVLDINLFSTTSTAYMLDESSYIWAYGGGSSGSLGNGWSSSDKSSPVAVIPDRRYVQLINNVPGALDASSYLWMWGDNTNGQVGINYNGTFIAVPRSVVGGKQWSTVTGGSTSYGLDILSYAWAWGSNSSGQIGDTTSINKSSPVSVVGGRQFIKISAGLNGVIALDKFSYAWAWGSNGNGVLGINTAVGGSSPVSVVGGRQFIYVNMGRTTTVALDGSSYAWAWGYNNVGQIGDGTYLSKSSPTSVLSTPWNNIITHAFTTIGLKDDGVYVWGSPAVAFGVSPYTSKPTKVNFPITTDKIKKIMCTRETTSFVCSFLDTSSCVWLWGNSATIGSTIQSPIRIFQQQNYSFYTQPQTFIKIINGGRSNSLGTTTYILDASSYAWCWGGNNENGELGIGFNSQFNICPLRQINPCVSSPVSVIGNRQFIDLTIGNYMGAYTGANVAGLDLSSYAWMWGTNFFGQCGNNQTKLNTMANNANFTAIIPRYENNCEFSPVSVVGGKRWIKVITNGNTSYGIDLSSYLWAWGRNNTGLLGNNSILDVSSPVSVVGNRQVLKVTATQTSCSFIDNSSYAWSFGSPNSYGVLGDNANLNRSSPVSVVGAKRFIDIYGAMNSICALDISSYMWAWGDNTNGFVGDNTITLRSSPVSVVGARRFVPNRTKISPVAQYAIAVDANSYAWAWGYNNLGQLGDNTILTRSSPISVFGNYQFKYIEASGCGLLGVATEYPVSQYICCGSNSPNYGDRYGYEKMTITNLSYPVVCNFAHTNINYSLTNIRKNILGK